MNRRPGFVAAIALALLAIAPAGASAATHLARAYDFLYRQMDKYHNGSELRLVQSYVRTPTFRDGDITYTYDDTVMIIALLQRGRGEDIRRAEVLGDSLVYAQQHDPYQDGRVRDGYHARVFIKPDGLPHIAFDDGDGGSDTGNMTWSGMALVQLFAATGRRDYLDAAKVIAEFIQGNCFDTRGAGGYTGGITQSQRKIEYKSTEHNIDLFGLFTMLAEATGDQNWSADAEHAANFVDAMWDPKGGHFYIGTLDNGVTINKEDPTPEDVQTWSYLSLDRSRYAHSIDWALRHLATNQGKFAGLSFEVKDRSGVWFEGTAHAAAALEARDLRGDAGKADQLLRDIEIGQDRAPNADGYGIDAASKDRLKTGDGDGLYFASLHIGATSWYCLAMQSGDPFRFVERSIP